MWQEVAERIRQEPYHPLRNDCIVKSVRFARECRRRGIDARVTVCIGLAKARLFGRRFTVPVLHAWGEVAGERVEVSRPLGTAGALGIAPVEIRPLVAVWPAAGHMILVKGRDISHI